MFSLTPYITNESLLEAKSNFRVQVSIKSGPKSYDKLPLTTTKISDFHVIFVYFSLTEALRMIVDMNAGWVGSKSENVEKASVVLNVFLLNQEGHEHASRTNEQ